MEFLKKISLLSFFIFTIACIPYQQNFINAKTHLVKIYSSKQSSYFFIAAVNFRSMVKSGLLILVSLIIQLERIKLGRNLYGMNMSY